jgi:hypothetical protein
VEIHNVSLMHASQIQMRVAVIWRTHASGQVQHAKMISAQHFQMIQHVLQSQAANGMVQAVK